MPIDYEPNISVADANDVVWFDIINRTITPQNEASIIDVLVQNDSNSRNFGFHIQRYFEGEDLSTKRIRIHYVNSLNQHDVASAHSIEVVGDRQEVVSFQWLISDKVCAENGDVQFAIEFYNNNETYRLFTKPTTISITEGICSVGEFIEPESDWFKEYSARMNVLEANMQSFNEAVDNGEFDGAYSLNTFATAIKGQKSGDIVQADDVASVGHTMNCVVQSKNLFDNLLDYKLATNTSYTYLDGVLTVTGQYANKHITLTEGKTYTFSCQSTRTSEYGGGVYIRAYTENLSQYVNLFGAISTLSPTATVTLPKGYSVLRISFYGDSSTGVGTATYTNIMLVEGEEPLEYSPYVDVTTATITICGKNLIDFSKATISRGSFEGNGIKTNITDAYYCEIGLAYLIDFIQNHDGETLTFSVDNVANDTQIMIVIKYTDTTYIQRMSSSNAVSIMIDNQGRTVNAVYLRPMRKVDAFTDTTTVIRNLQLEIGETATEYEEQKGYTYYTPNADGTVVGVTSLSPTTTLWTDTPNVIINCEYNRDTNIVYNDMITRIQNIESMLSSLTRGTS